ncbi:MAG TPA: hypothetical protein ENK91_04145 [Bacteroidetes bacterium]|nr:hypothetical protein [Bacteroidota bacterium]
MSRINFKFTEIVLLVFVWILLLTAPIFFRRGELIEWSDLLGPLDILIPLFIIFLVNRLILVPKLLFAGKNLLYLFSVALVIAIVASGAFFLTPLVKGDNPLHDKFEQMSPPPQPNERAGADFPPPKTQGRRNSVPPFIDLLVFSVLMVGFDTGLKASFRLFEIEKEKGEIEKENISNQLNALRNQISPHFFMNTLNNIHALIDINSEEAKHAVIKLSEMMDYMLYESQSDSVALKRELVFIKSYVELMKLRFTDEVDIVLDFPESIPNIQIPPLLSISFIENAFKHGISYKAPSFVHIKFKVEENQLQCSIRNSDYSKTVESKNSGIGIKNTKSRLDLLYKDKYQLAINRIKGKSFEVKINIPI